MSAARNTLIVLRQVEGPRWCVVQHGVRNGRRVFVGRIATARDYAPACRIAMDSAKRMGLHLAIEGCGKLIRRFDPKHDAPAMEVTR
jgi:hypothetical protein